jgi:hypothetical protein
MNNSTLYQNESNNFTRAVYISLMGDPTLRMDPVSPPSALAGTASGGSVNLHWSPSPDTVVGYHVYRSDSPGGPLLRRNGSLISGTNFADLGVASQLYTYMVRAVKLQTTPSGSYFNGSQGTFTTVDVANSAEPIRVVPHLFANGLTVTWNSQSGQVCRVLAKSNLNETYWVDVSGDILATGTNTSWTNSNLSPNPQRFYRIANP